MFDANKRTIYILTIKQISGKLSLKTSEDRQQYLLEEYNDVIETLLIANESSFLY